MIRITSKPILSVIGMVVSLTMSASTFADEHSGGGYRGGQGSHGEHGHELGDSHDATTEHGSHRGGAHAVERDVLSHGQGQRPVWAQENLPEVELGRLNAARAPGFVLNRALVKAHQSLTNGEQLIHSPLQNLALYKEAVLGGNLTEAAQYLGQASEKKQPITADTVMALNLILGVSVSNDAQLASNADKVRQSLADAHDTDHTDDHH